MSGLLNPQIGGPSVFPYQPTGYWAALNFPPREWHNDTATKLYRRGMYTHWQRSFPQPSLLAFDAPSREECTVERPRSNIPQQALVLLNDPTFVEAARVFAERIIKEGGSQPAQRATLAFTEVLSRQPTPDELKVLTDLHARHRDQYTADRDAALKLLRTGDHTLPLGADPVDLAAWTSVARVLLNLHETVTRPLKDAATDELVRSDSRCRLTRTRPACCSAAPFSATRSAAWVRWRWRRCSTRAFCAPTRMPAGGTAW